MAAYGSGRLPFRDGSAHGSGGGFDLEAFGSPAGGSAVPDDGDQWLQRQQGFSGTDRRVPRRSDVESGHRNQSSRPSAKVSLWLARRPQQRP